MFARIRDVFLIVLTVFLAVATVALVCEFGPTAHAQISSSTAASRSSAPSTTIAASTGEPAMDPERQQVWNSPEMLRARAWLAEYSKNTESLGEAETAKRMSTLANMTPDEMKLFTIRHEHEYQQQKKQAAAIQKLHETALQQATAAAEAQKWWYQNVHKAELQQAVAVNKGAQQSLADISSEENAAAGQAESEINTENAEEQAAGQERMGEMNAFNPGVGLPYGGYGPIGGYHYHFHVYTNPY
jgi:hypothetical protein